MSSSSNSSGGIVNSISNAVNSAVTTGGNILANALSAIGSALGIQSQAPVDQNSDESVAGISTQDQQVCTKCIVVPVLLGELLATALYIFLAVRKKENASKKSRVLLGLFIPALCYIIFIIINLPCIKPMIIFPSLNPLCRWFTFISLGIYALPMLFLYVQSKNSSKI
ncbi:hypothetical protein HY947_05550 [Candidatus Gottesmanbacteria bacterium]|nr:hypothetical protein [Candidatus Gottesmanbacteria bacterium]